MTAVFFLFITGNTWNITASEKLILTSLAHCGACVCGCYMLLFSLFTSVSESHYFPHAPMMCVVSVILANDCRVFLFITGNTWNITASEKLILTSLAHCGACVCGCYMLLFSLFTSVSESHYFPHAPMMCVVSVILANDCHLFCPLHYCNAWNIIGSE